MTAPLRLTALDEHDLAAISAALQDAVALLGDFEHSKRLRSFTMAFNRFCWEAGRRDRRVRSGVQIGHVTAARSRNIRQGAEDAVVNLLAIRFEPGELPSGQVVCTFSGGGELRLDVECLDVVLVDLSRPWRATARPQHETADIGEPDEETQAP
ncbi:MAG: hypothetical protein ACJAU5_001208 [Maricaulis maris]|jgi:hypothetical protein|uniref:DUF2948 family protein n=1 Tax=Maricaulis TaxID=74317 RepID=UPI000C3B9EF1|nr:DUF2948 family protein [Maricaulis sp.]MAC89701.1 hypothetical protein [Maricaulis sp.]